MMPVGTQRPAHRKGTTMTEQEFIDVLRPLMEETGVETSGNLLDKKFSELNLDSLTQIELISNVEDAFDYQIEYSVIREINTPRRLMEVISRAIAV
jgi:acyl carrier protein